MKKLYIADYNDNGYYKWLIFVADDSNNLNKEFAYHYKAEYGTKFEDYMNINGIYPIKTADDKKREYKIKLI